MNKTTVYFAKLHDDVILPSKREEDGAFDIYAHFEGEHVKIAPHETVMIPTGLISAFSSDYVAILKERGSTGTKGIGQRSGVIDSGYRGEWVVPITNHNDKPLLITKEKNDGALECLMDDYILYPYSKAICQCVIVPVPPVVIEERTVEEIESIESERGAGKLGSTNK